MSFNGNMSIPTHNKNYSGNIFTANGYMNPTAVNSGIPSSAGTNHPGLQYFQAYPQPQQPQAQQLPTSVHPQQTIQDYYTTSSSSNNTLSNGSASSTAPTSISDMPLPGQQQPQQQHQQYNQSMLNPSTAKTIMPQMISGTGASSNPPMPLDPNVTTKFTNNDIQILRQLLIAGEKYKWKQITREINSSTNHTQHVLAAINKNQQHLSQIPHLQQSSQSQSQQHQQSQSQSQLQSQHNQHQMHQQALSYGYQQQSHMMYNGTNVLHKSNSTSSAHMIPPHQTQNTPRHGNIDSRSPHSNNQNGQPSAATPSITATTRTTTTTTSASSPSPMPLKNVSPTFVMKQYQQLLGLPSNSVYFGTLGSSLPYVVAANGWSDIDQEAYNYQFNMDDEE
ncbi:hypothetical protein KGF57_002432 [Candida theae]|uniref:Uncharacterized protein n=1 Tax=Candida theae TaxID=1198502 RepID=A0AAD5BFG0_9ASCO|nr:uncharacterized protein KGF57_002432 [Candida theae]KAI5958587.1 hypothetical protein KGF57_002432 [Candida theae]